MYFLNEIALFLMWDRNDASKKTKAQDWKEVPILKFDNIFLFLSIVMGAADRSH